MFRVPAGIKTVVKAFKPNLKPKLVFLGIIKGQYLTLGLAHSTEGDQVLMLPDWR